MTLVILISGDIFARLIKNLLEKKTVTIFASSKPRLQVLRVRIRHISLKKKRILILFVMPPLEVLANQKFQFIYLDQQFWRLLPRLVEGLF